MKICIAGISQDALALALVLRHFGQCSIVGLDWTAHSEAVQLGVCDDPAVGELIARWPIPYTNQPRIAVQEGADLLIMAGNPDRCIRTLHSVVRTGWRGPAVAIDPLPPSWQGSSTVLEMLRQHYTLVGHAPFHFARDPIDRLTNLRRVRVQTRVPAVRDVVAKVWSWVDNKIPVEMVP